MEPSCDRGAVTLKKKLERVTEGLTTADAAAAAATLRSSRGMLNCAMAAAASRASSVWRLAFGRFDAGAGHSLDLQGRLTAPEH